ncbi:hypothetical protein L5L78_22845 [Shewanella sp. SM34]|uniref:hypothetical protein n=1 Tax=unclassified Shewanella TaxID=196818 RepID=UPI0021DA32A2|nr:MULTISPECIES: hypothetical protein [unclassified Shewanella]MCU8058993.1 hypothetical protein [Shewanella sp. SM35]MCU8067910.1 hypothetical protein [Shewanella sp. SM34]
MLRKRALFSLAIVAQHAYISPINASCTHNHQQMLERLTHLQVKQLTKRKHAH